VIYLCCEDDEEEVNRRVVDMARGMSVDVSQLTDLMIVPLAEEDAVLAAAEERSNVLTTTLLYDQIAKWAKELRPVLIILDTLADGYAASENNRMLAKQFVKAIRKLVVPYGGTGMLLAHPSLTGMANGTGASGTTGWNNSVRWRLYMTRVVNEEGQEPDRTKRLIKVVKTNYGEDGLEILLHRADGYYVMETPNATGGPLATEYKANRVFLELLDAFTKRGEVVSNAKGATNFAPKLFAQSGGSEGFTRTQFASTMRRLLDTNQIEVGEVGKTSQRKARFGLRRVVAPPPDEAAEVQNKTSMSDQDIEGKKQRRKR
jgi:RecA-family ATPase